MSNMYKTARGASIDFNSLRLNNGHVIAVGNAGVNARGDAVKNGKVVKTREEIMQETYNIQGSTIAKDSKMRRGSKDIEPDTFVPRASTPVITEPTPVVVEEVAPVLVDVVTQSVEEVVNIEQPTLENKPRGGLADAINRNKDISDLTDKLDLKRKRI